MERAAVSASAPPAVAFRDGLGERRHVVDPTGHEALEVLCLRGELSTVPSFEFALRERVGRLAQFRHTCYGRVRGVERLGAREATLAIVSDATPGVRLSEILSTAEQRRLPLDINTALCLIRQLVPAVAMLHENAGETSHGAIGPERLIVTPDARLVIVEYVAGAALEQLRYSRERYWTELRVPLPRTAGLSRFDQRVDVTQIGAVALALILGRLLKDDEYPSRVTDLVASTWAVSPRGGFEPLPPGLRAWLGRALQLDSRSAFASAIDARVELDKVIGDSEFIASPASLEEFLTRFREAAPAAVVTSTPPVRAAATPLSPVMTPVPLGFSPPVLRPVEVPQPVQVTSAKPPTPVDVPAITADYIEPVVLRRVAATPFRTTAIADLKIIPAAEPIEDHSDARVQQSTRKWPVFAAVAAVVIIATGGYTASRYFTEAPIVVATGTLVLTTNPSGAKIAVDGEARGITPVTLTLAPGAHEIELTGAGEPRLMRVTITAGTEATQYIELAAVRSTSGQLQVRTNPPGAQVVVDGVARGVSPTTVADLAPGEHAVLLTNAVGSSRQTVTIEGGATASLVATLVSAENAPQSGWISISAPVGVQLFENGSLLGTSATDQIMVSAGRHEVDLVNEALGYKVTRIVQVLSGKVASISLELPKGSLALNALPWAEVWIDGERAGETPIGNLSVTIGSHDVVFRHPELGEQHHTAVVTLKSGAKIVADLRKK